MIEYFNKYITVVLAYIIIATVSYFSIIEAYLLTKVLVYASYTCAGLILLFSISNKSLLIFDKQIIYNNFKVILGFLVFSLWIFANIIQHSQINARVPELQAISFNIILPNILLIGIAVLFNNNYKNLSLPPTISDGLLAQAKKHPKLFLHNAILAIESYAKTFVLTITLVIIIMTLIIAVTAYSFNKNFLEFPVISIVITMVLSWFFIYLVTTNLPGWSIRKKISLGYILIAASVFIVISVLTLFYISEDYFTHKVFKISIPHGFIAKFSNNHIVERFSGLWFAWYLLWSLELAAILNRLSKNISIWSLLLLAPLCIISDAMWLELFNFLTLPIMQVLGSIISLLMIFSIYKNTLNTTDLYCGMLPYFYLKPRSLLKTLKRLLVNIPILLMTYVIFGWMIIQYFSIALQSCLLFCIILWCIKNLYQKKLYSRFLLTK